MRKRGFPVHPSGVFRSRREGSFQGLHLRSFVTEHIKRNFSDESELRINAREESIGLQGLQPLGWKSSNLWISVEIMVGLFPLSTQSSLSHVTGIQLSVP